MLLNKRTRLELTYCFLPLCRFAFVFVIMAATDSVQTTKTISLQVWSPICAFLLKLSPLISFCIGFSVAYHLCMPAWQNAQSHARQLCIRN